VTPVDFAERSIIVSYDVQSVLADAAGDVAGTDVAPHKKR
jgi:hypothetical protein